MANIKVPLISRTGFTSDGGSIRFENADYMLLPKGSDAQRPPAPATGMIRNNTTIDAYEAYHKSRWWELGLKTNWNIVTGDTTITNGMTSYGIFVGNISVPITITLPAIPKKDDNIVIVDGLKKFAQYPLTVALNGNKFQGTTSNIVINSAGAGVTLSWSGDSTVGWVLESSAVPYESPNFTGTPTAPTAAIGTNTTQLATTAFVLSQASASNPVMNGTVAIGTSLRYARADHVHPTDTTRAPLASPALTGTPTAPTATAGTNTTQIATTAFVTTAVSNIIAAAPGTLDTLNELASALGNDANFATTVTNQLASKAPLASPALTGTPTAPTPTAGTNTTQLATTAFVKTVADGKLTKSVAGGVNVTLTSDEASNAILDLTGAITANIAVIVPSVSNSWIVRNSTTGAFSLTVKTAAGTGIVVSKASTTTLWCDGTNVLLMQTDYTSPSFTGSVTAENLTVTGTTTLQGTSTALTPAVDNNTTSIATTAFVVGQAATVASPMNGTAAVGTSLKYARQDHVHATDTSRAPLASPTLTGTPAAPTAAANTNTTQIATTAFVVGQASSTSPSMNGTLAVGTLLTYARGDHVHPTDTSRAPLASPALTGTPTAPTAAVGTNTTQLATTAFVQAEIANDAAPIVHTHNLIDIVDSPYKTEVKVATTAALTATYANGALGVGATLTNSGTLAALSIDGITMLANDRVLVKNQATAFQNGIYTVTNVGSGAIAWVLTRSTDCDTAADIAASMTPVDLGTVNGGRTFTTTFKSTDVVGTTAVNWYEIPSLGAALGNSMAVLTDASGRLTTSGTVTATELGYLDGVSSAIQTQLNAKAALASPALTGTPTAPTAAGGTNTTQIATTAFVQSESVLWAIVFG